MAILRKIKEGGLRKGYADTEEVGSRVSEIMGQSYL